MNSEYARGFRNLGFGLFLAAWPAPAYSPDAESVLDFLDRRIAGGFAAKEVRTAFTAFLEDAGPEEAGCEAWGPGSEAYEVRKLHPDLDRAVSEACQEPETEKDSTAIDRLPSSAAPAPGMTARAPGTAGGRPAMAIRTGITHSAKPRRAASPAPVLDQEGKIAPLRWKASLRDFRLHARHAELRLGELTVHAGHLRSGLSRTRLSFVAGGGFYEGWSGASGAGGALQSRYAALDGLGVSLRSGAWTWDAAGTWNRLTRTGRPDSKRLDALLYVVGLAREPKGGKSGKGTAFPDALDFRLQAAHQRFEPSTGPPLAVSVAGASLTGFRGRLGLGLAGSWLDTGGIAGMRPGGYAEFWAAAPETEEGGFRLEIRQASPDWANPLQSPRGYIRDTVGGLLLSGRGQGSGSVRARLPVAAAGAYRMSLRPGASTAWFLGGEGLRTGEARLALAQEWGPWTHETGTGLRRPGSYAASPEGAPVLGQTVTWISGGWKAEASFLPRGKGYRGSRPAPLHLDLGHRRKSGGQAVHPGPYYWRVETLLGDVREPKRYLRLVLRQGWDLSGGFRVVQALRLPWERGVLSPDMGYQLRLETVF